MSTMLPTLMSWLQEYGYPALWITIFLASVGLPLPISLLLLGTGAFAALGQFNIVELAIVAVTASVCGDSTGYLLGRYAGSRILKKLEKRRDARFLSPATIARSRGYFQKRGGWAIFLSRFLFSALGSPINLLAGAEGYAYRRFLVCDVGGEALGAAIPLGLGFAFGASWEAVGEIFGLTSLFLLLLAATMFLLFALLKQFRRGRKREEESAGLRGVSSISGKAGIGEESDV
ncbi:MAG: DedA family protein, partial [Ktedonobacteraceae bacterium]|nr:DedA family protein [Ktedonobacteraceae bacterium]